MSEEAEPESRAASRVRSFGAAFELERRYRDGLKLTEVNRALVGSFDFDRVTEVLCRAARELTGADGATIGLREGSRVRYAAENSVAPLLRGQSFGVDRCASGWAMLHREAAVIENVHMDARVPHDALRGSFVQSMVAVPVGPVTPVASLDVYWAHRHVASAYEVELLQSLASAADLALAGVRAFQEARRAWAEAEQANHLKDEFLATLSHELRNPLNSIVGFSELLLRSPEAHQHPLIWQAASTIHSNAQAQSRLVSDLLDLSRLQTGKLAIERHPVYLAPLVADAVEAVRTRADEKDVELRVELPPPPLVVNADHVRIQEIVWNLVQNAVKFTPKGGRVHVSLVERDGEAELVVEDTGQGIDPEFLPYVFEMFRQGDARTTRAQSGLGIGLALVRQLVELHDGRVEAQSAGLGRGARFVVRLPIDTAPAATGPDVSSPAGSALVGVRVLVVDDTEDSVEMLRQLLEGEGAEVAMALDGSGALKLAASAQFDLVISDISMPEMDGYELIQRLRREPQYAATPAFALTGFGRDEDVARALAAGFTHQLTKPLDFPALVRLIRAVLNR